MTVFSITAKAAGWKALSHALSSLNEEAFFEITTDGIKTSIIDLAHVTILSLFWKKENIDEYTLDAEQKIGFRADDLYRIMKRFSVDDTITVQYTEEKKIRISQGKRVFNMSTINAEMLNTSPVPKIDFDVVIDCIIKDVKTALDDALIFSDDLFTLSTKDKEFFMNVKDQSGDSTSSIECNIIKSADISTTYGLEYISNMINIISPYTDKINISYSKNKPVKMVFNIDNSVDITFYVAPKVL